MAQINSKSNVQQFVTTESSNGHGTGHGYYETDGEEDEGSLFKSFLSYSVCGILLIIYCAAGAYVFMTLEADDDRSKTMHHRQLVAIERQKLSAALFYRNNTCQNWEKDTTCTLDVDYFNTVLREYELSLDKISDGALTQYINENENPKGRWSYFHSLLFVFTLVTTIGYGNLTPRTTTGRVFCILFALIGIPLALIEIALAGKLLAKTFTLMFKKFVTVELPELDYKSSKRHKVLGTGLSVFGVLSLLLCYNAIGAFLYDLTEDWGWINSFYFCFTTLTTVGFGDLIPTAGVASGNPFASVRVIYVLFGLALTSTSFELVRVHYAKAWTKKMNKRFIRPKTPALFIAVQQATKQHQEEMNGNIENHKSESDYIPDFGYIR